AGVPLREFRRTRKIQAEKPITARRMESTRLPRPIQPRQQEDEDEDHPMPQAGEENEEGNEDKNMTTTTTSNQNMSIINTTMSSRNPNSNITKSSMNHQYSHLPIMFQLTPINIKKTLTALKLSCRT
ncbi:hypothetical protein PIB30_110063, partial [Stylosanthes scabra]|nr:hypothetical protein [Stylosanthes scabra]